METFAFLLIDGITNGAGYALVALSLIVVFTVTRVVNIAQGEYVMLGALSLASGLAGSVQPLLPFVLAGIALFTMNDVATDSARMGGARLPLLAGRAAWLAGVAGVSLAARESGGSYWLAALSTIVLVASLGALVYRLTVAPSPDASPVVLVIVSVGVYMVLHGTAVLLWGAEPRPVPPLSEGGVDIGPVFVPAQSLWICIVSLVSMALLWLLAERTLLGKALQAAASNRTGARLCGIPTLWAGQLSFGLAAGFSALSGMLLAPLITANYDMGFPIGLKAFVAAALGGVAEYGTALVGVGLLGQAESIAAFNASSWREPIVFILVIPVLLWRNTVKPPVEQDV